VVWQETYRERCCNEPIDHPLAEEKERLQEAGRHAHRGESLKASKQGRIREPTELIIKRRK